MLNPFRTGDQKQYTTFVTEDKLASFDAGMVHPVYSTFALGKDAEWACRLFVLEMKESGEEGIGSFLSVEHVSPALLDAEVRFIATLMEVVKNEVVCTYEAYCNERLIARGRQVQKIIDKGRFDRLLSELRP